MRKLAAVVGPVVVLATCCSLAWGAGTLTERGAGQFTRATGGPELIVQYTGNVTGKPITGTESGGFLAIAFAPVIDPTCPGQDAFGAFGGVTLTDASGSVNLNEDGDYCLSNGTFRGTYDVESGTGIYAGASGTGHVTVTTSDPMAASGRYRSSLNGTITLVRNKKTTGVPTPPK